MNPSKVQARKMVLVSTFLLIALSVYRDRSGKTDSPQGTFRVVWGAGIVGMFLSLLADFAPAIAGPFAVLIVLGSLTNGGDQALLKILSLVGPPPAGSDTGAGGSSSGQGLKGPSGTPTTNPPPAAGKGLQGPAGTPTNG